MRIYILLVAILAACSEVPGGPLEATSSTSDAGSAFDGSTSSGGTDAGGVDKPPPPPFDPVVDAERRAAARCERSRRCDPEAHLIRWGSDPETCVEVTAAGLVEVRRGIWRRAGYRQIADAIQNGRVRFERDVFEDCIEGYRTAACGTIYRCPSPFVGTVAPRASCHIDEECSGDRYCDSERMIECGTCQDRLHAGDEARRFGMCSADSFFAITACAAYAAEGEPCSRFVTSSVRAFCGPGFFCRGETDSGICVPAIVRGGACEVTFECEGTGVCDQNVCVDPILRRAGEPCETRAHTCIGDLHCSRAGICEPLPTAGEECTFDNRCAGDSFCSGRMCEPYATVGERCAGLGANDESCEAGAVCSDALPPLCTTYEWTICGG